jgi:hypothetical protein
VLSLEHHRDHLQTGYGVDRRFRQRAHLVPEVRGSRTVSPRRDTSTERAIGFTATVRT